MGCRPSGWQPSNKSGASAGRAAIAFKVVDLEATVANWQHAGGEVTTGIEDGPHDRRAVVRDPWGNLALLYSPRP